MAKEIDKLYVSLGVNTDDLKVGFEKSDQTINQYISKLNQQAKNIKLKADIDLSKLELSGNTLDKLRVKAKALQAELDIAKQKQSISAQTLALNSQKYGVDSAITRKSQTIDLYRQRDVTKLENDLKRVNTELDKLAPKSQSAFSRFGASITTAQGKVTGVISSIGKLNAAITAGVAAISAGAGIFALTDKAMLAGESLYKLSTRLNMTQAEASKLSKVFQLSGVDINSVVPLFARIDKQVLAAAKSQNSLSKAMQEYNFTLTDSNGNILSYDKQLEQLAKGYQSAVKSGKEAEFVANVLGARGAGLIPVLQDLGTNLEIVSRIQSNGLLNKDEAHALFIEWQAMQMQAGQLTGALGQALLPVAKELMPEITQGFKEFAKLIADNKDGIKEFGSAAGTAIGGIASSIATVVSALGELKKLFSDILGSSDKVQKLKEDGLGGYLNQGKTAGSILGGMVGFAYGGIPGAAVGAGVGSNVGESIYANVGWALMSDEEKQAIEIRRQLREKEKQAFEEFNKQIKEEQKKTTTESIKLEQDAAKIKTDLQDQLTHTTNEKLREQLQAIQEKVQASIAEGEDEASAWNKVADSIKKAMKDAAKEAQEANKNLDRSIYRLTHSDYENALKDIDYSAEDTLKKGADPARVAREAELKKAKVIEDNARETAQYLDSIFENSLTQRLNQIEREKQAWIKKGMAEVTATRAAEEQKRQAVNDSVKNMFTSQKKYLQLYRNAMAGQVSAEGGMYDFTQSQSDRQQNAIKAIRRLMMQEAGISPNERTSMAEIQGFQAAMKEANMWGSSLVRDGDGNAYNFSDLASTITESGSQTNSILSQINNEVPQINSNLLNVRDAVSNISINPGFTIKDVTDLYKNSAEQKTEQKETDVSVKTDSTELINKLTEITNTINNEIPSISSNIASLKTSLDNFIIQPATDNNSIRIVELMENQNALLMQQNVDIPSINTNLINLLNAVQNNSTANNSNGLNELSNNFSQYSSNISRVLESINDSIPSINVNLSGILEKMNQNRQAQPPQINVSPNINVNLGGAYVFDNAMKQQLTDDITREVANGVTQAVNEATSQIQTGFAS